MIKTLVWIAIVIAAIVLAVLFGGREPAIAPEAPPNPFTTVWGLGERQVVTFSGDSAGHVAGEESKFTLALDNRAEDIHDHWHVECCMLLLDEDGIVLEIAHRKVSIPGGTKHSETITVRFPADLDGPYGLSLVFPSRGQSIQTIWVGEIRPVSAGPWPELDTCPGT